jgi:hypothetical protein
MAEVPVFDQGGYRYIKAVFQYSGGVAAQPGFELQRVRFRRPPPLAMAFAAVEAYLDSIGRPTTAFAACELRSPAPFTEQGFYEFNKVYVTRLERWGIYRGGEQPINPVARSNVCPMYDKPPEPVMYAFSYTVPLMDEQAPPPNGTFVLAGGGEAREQGASYQERIVRLNDTSPEGMRDKVDHVVTEMQRRLSLLGFGWRDALATQAYSVQNIGHLVGEMLASRGACAHGLIWHYARPPVVGLEYEMDVRATAAEFVL